MAEKKTSGKATKTSPPKAKTGVAAKAPKAQAPKAEPKVKAEVVAKAPRVKKPKSEASTAPVRESGRKTRTGLVVSNKMEKTVVVEIHRRTQHPIYSKVVIRSTKFKAHDLVGCSIGDLVEIMETRPISRDKHWRVVKILEKVK